MKTGKEGEGELNREGGLLTFLLLKRAGLIREGGLNRGFTVNMKFQSVKSKVTGILNDVRGLQQCHIPLWHRIYKGG